jgi:hypothetical protein
MPNFGDHQNWWSSEFDLESYVLACTGNVCTPFFSCVRFGKTIIVIFFVYWLEKPLLWIERLEGSRLSQRVEIMCACVASEAVDGFWMELWDIWNEQQVSNKWGLYQGFSKFFAFWSCVWDLRECLCEGERAKVDNCEQGANNSIYYFRFRERNWGK